MSPPPVVAVVGPVGVGGQRPASEVRGDDRVVHISTGRPPQPAARAGAGPWQAATIGLGSVILVRLAINANNFVMSRRAASPTPPEFRLGFGARLRDWARLAQLVAQGLSNGEIAERLVISTHTVRTHLQSISGRLGVSSRGKLAARVHELGL